MVDTVCSNREMIRVAGDDYPAAVSYTHLDVYKRQAARKEG